MLIQAVTITLLLSATQTPAGGRVPAPEGWRVHSLGYTLSRDDRSCANVSDNRWRVMLEGDALVIQRAEAEVSLPPWTARFQPHASVEFGGGHLLAGNPTDDEPGGLWWLDAGVTERRLLLDVDVVHLRYDSGGSVLAFSQAEDGDRTDVYRVTTNGREIEAHLVGPLGADRVVVDDQGHLPLPDVFPFSGGFLLAIDRGEDIGGGLWWADAQGVRQTRLMPGNVNHLEGSTDGSVLAFTTGNIGGRGGVFCVRASGGRILVKPLGPLDGTAHVVSPVQDYLMAVTDGGVWSLRADEEPSRLAEVDTRFLSPNSIVVRGDGTIYVGMKAFILRLLRTGSGYESEWLLPAGCAGLARRGSRCECR